MLIGPEDIHGCNLKLILGLVWTLIGHYQIRSSGRGLSTKQAMKEWLHTLIPDYNIQNFNTDWNDGRPLCGLVDRLQPGLCPNHMSLSPSKGLENCRMGMELAKEHLQVPMILDPEDLNNPDVDDLSVMTYISYFFEPARISLLQWIQQKIPQCNITNLSTDWNNGVNLSALMDSCHNGLCPDWKKLDPYKAHENLEKCIKLSKDRLDIVCPVGPETLSDPKVDEIIVATYLSRFKYARLLNKAEDLALTAPDFSDKGCAVVKEPVHVPLDLGDNPELSLGHIVLAVAGPSADVAVSIDSSDPYNTKAKFIPLEPGMHEVSCHMNEENIRGSPLSIPVIDPQEWNLTKEPPAYLHVNASVELELTGKTHSSQPVVGLDILNNQGFPATHLEGSVSEKESGTYLLMLSASGVGPADVSVTVAGQNIRKSPFSVSVCDPSKCVVSGLDDDSTVLLGEPVSFNIDTENTGEDKPIVKATGPSIHYAPNLEKADEGLHIATFTPTEIGQHSVDVFIAGEHVPGSPFTVPVLDPEQWGITTEIPQYLQVNTTLCLELCGPEFGEPLVSFTVLDTATQEESDLAQTTLDKKDAGVYELSLLCAAPCIIESHVTVAETEVKKSPFSLVVCDTGKCIVSGLDNAQIVLGDPITFTVNTTDAGDDEPKVTLQGPTVLYVPVMEKEGNSKYDISFTPKEVGNHTIAVAYGGQDVPGSPFQVSVVNPNAWYFLSKIPRVLQVGQLVQMDIAGSDDKENNLHCHIKSPDGDILDASLTKQVENPFRWTLTLIPTQIGNVQVRVNLHHNDINGSPFDLKILDASKCHVDGLTDDNAQLGEPISFTVACNGAGDDKPIVNTQGPSTQYMPEGEDDGNGTYLFTFTPFEVGPIKTTISFGGQEIPGSPFQKSIVDVPNADECSARGPGLSRAIAGRPAKFVIITPEKGLLTKKDALTVDIINAKKTIKVEPTIEDLQDKTYGVSYTVPTEGDYLITIKLYDKPIPGCDFNVKAFPKPDASKCRVYGPSIHPNALLLSGRPLELYVDTKNAGPGELQAVVQGPKKTSPKIYMAEDDRVFSLRVDTNYKGWYRINIWWAQVHVPQSPIDLKVHQAPDASKVRAYGPGLGPQIEVHKPAEFFILTQDAGIGTLTVIVHGVKDAFEADVKAENPLDPRSLKGLYYPREGGDYAVTIKWSGNEIPGSPFPVKVVDKRHEAELEAEEKRMKAKEKEKEKKEKKRKKQQELLRQQQLALVQAQSGINPMYAADGGVLRGMTNNPTMLGMMATPATTSHTVTTHTTKKLLQKQMAESRSKSLEVSDESTTQRPRKKSAPTSKKKMLELTSSSSHSRKTSAPAQLVSGLPASTKKLKKCTSSIEDVMAQKAGSLQSETLWGVGEDSFDVKAAKAATSPKKKMTSAEYTFNEEDIPIEEPVSYTPLFHPPDVDPDYVKPKKKKGKKQST